jgi:hypothetical protein
MARIVVINSVCKHDLQFYGSHGFGRNTDQAEKDAHVMAPQS